MNRVLWRRTPFDLALFVFLGTAVLGLWAAYDRTQAGIKLANIVASIVIFYILSSQRRRKIWQAAGALGVLASGIAIYFLLTHDWQAWPADIALLTRLGQGWMRVRPELPLPALHPNIAGGLMVVLLPFAAAFTVYGFRKQQVVVWGLGGLLTGITLLGALLTSSRAAWLSLAAALGVWFLWLMSDRFGRMLQWPRRRMFYLLLVLMSGLSVGLSFVVSDGPLALAGRLPGMDSTISRLDLFGQSLDLIADYPFTGSGLASFPGLYSQYIAITPFFLFNYAHNLWLDVALEQTVIGALALLWLLVGSGVLLGRTIFPQKATVSSKVKRKRLQADYEQFRQELTIFRWATLIGLLVMGLHGLVDDAFYGGLGTPLLFVLPGMATAVARKQEVRRMLPSMLSLKRGLILVALAVVIGIGAGRVLAANWHANVGAVMMGRVELQNWPTGEWDDGRNTSALQPAQTKLQQALALDPHNRTAHYRLGLITMLEREYGTAATHLQAAYTAGGDHRGIGKTLGYSYVWSGEMEKAAVLLADIPEAQREMDAYVWWWQTQGQGNLSDLALQMKVSLEK